MPIKVDEGPPKTEPSAVRLVDPRPKIVHAPTTRRIARVAIVVASATLLMAGAAPAAHAAVLGTCGQALVTSPPPSVVAGASESDTHIEVITEQTDLSLPSALAVDITPPGTFPAVYDSPSKLTPGNIDAGTAVDSYYLHSDPVGTPTGPAAVQYSATLTFTTDILGLITGGEPSPVFDANLDVSDAVVGVPTTTYGHENHRGLELSPTNDQVTLLSSRQIRVSLIDTVFTDDIRVITASTRAHALATAPGGYRFVASDGGIFTFGNQPFLGSMGGKPLNQPMVGGVNTCSNDGYWTVATDGGIFTFGSAQFFGSTGSVKLNMRVVSMAATATQQGYWLFATDGGVFAFGDARFLGSMGAVKLNRPVVGGAADPTTKGYWMVATDGGIFSFGAPFFGSTGATKLNQPVVGMAPTPDGLGYWLVAADGGVFTFGDAAFYGSTGALRLNRPIVGMKVTPTGLGYWLISADGGVFSFGDAAFYGSTGSLKLNKPIVSAL